MKFHELLYAFTSGQSAKESFETYIRFYNECLQENLEVISCDKNMAINLPIFKDIMKLHGVLTIFEYPNLAFLSPSIVPNMLKGNRAPLAIDYSISFESNTARYLHDYITTGKETIKGFQETLHYFLENNYNLDPLFYIIESVAKGEDSEKFYENMFSIKKLMTCDMNYYNECKKIKSIFNDNEIKSLVKEDVEFLKNDYSLIIETVKKSHLQMKIMILAMYLGHLKYNKDQEEHFYKFMIKLMHNKLKAIMLREFIIAINFFEYEKNKHLDSYKNEKSKYKIFDSLSTMDQNKFFEELDNIAWDFTLVRQLETYFTTKPNAKADFFIPFIFTYDKGLQEIIKIFYCKDFLIFHNEKNSIPIPHGNLNITKLQKYNLNEYFTVEAFMDRKNSSKVDFESLFNELKDEFIKKRFKNNCINTK